MIRTGDSEIRDELRRQSKDSSDKEVTSAKNPAGREPGLLAFLNDRNSNMSDHRRSRRFDQMRFGDDDDGIIGGGDDGDFDGGDSLDICAPI